MKDFKRTLVTTALPYANGPVHIGHLAGVYVPADSYVRYLRLKGEEVLVGIGKYGPYVRHGSSFVSMPKGDDPYTVTLERACELIDQREEKAKAAKEPIKRFDGVDDLVILSGIYGPYIQCAGKNYRIPKTKDPLAMTVEECRAIIGKKRI